MLDFLWEQYLCTKSQEWGNMVTFFRHLTKQNMQLGCFFPLQRILGSRGFFICKSDSLKTKGKLKLILNFNWQYENFN